MLEAMALNEIKRADLELLITNETQEGRKIDYKRDLNLSSDEDRRELAKDVASFANAGGGDLVYGVDEKGGVPTQLLGVACQDFDATKRRIDSIVQDLIAPRLPAIEIGKVDDPGFSNGPVIIVRVQRSWTAPHMVSYKNQTHFYSRNNGGRKGLDVREIGAAFVGNADLARRVRAFRDERIGLILANETPVPLYAQARVAVHVVPIHEHELNPPEVERLQPYMRPMSGSSFNHHFNIDGFTTYDAYGDQASSYAQAFRHGALEAVSAAHTLSPVEDGKAATLLYPLPVERDVVNTVSNFIAVLAAHAYSGPVTVMVSLIDVKGATLEHGLSLPRHPSERRRAIDREVVILPDRLIERADVDLKQELRTVFDAMWQSGGFKRSYGYDENGKWRDLADQRS